jgi:hypothetical protein
MMEKLIGIMIALTVAATAAHAQDARLEARLPVAARPAVLSIVERARAEGLPTEPLVQRALEGVSRNSSGELIEDAVRDLAARLRRARTALGRNATEAELVSAAGALNVGLNDGDLARLRAAGAGIPLSLPLVTLADLLQRGVARDAATSAILALVAAGMPPEAYTQLGRSVAQDIRQGASPASAVQTRTQGLLVERRSPPRAAPPGSPRPSPPRRVGGTPLR